MGIKIAVPALGPDIIFENARPLHRSRVSAEDYVWYAYSSMGQYMVGQYKYLSNEIRRVKTTWQYVLRKAKNTWILFL